MFDISGGGSKDYKLNFMAMRAGVYKLTCSFKVESSGEYVVYKVNVTVVETEDTETIDLFSAIRESVSQGVVIENPTNQQVVIN